MLIDYKEGWVMTDILVAAPPETLALALTNAQDTETIYVLACLKFPVRFPDI
jgi:hypothetical protein